MEYKISERLRWMIRTAQREHACVSPQRKLFEFRNIQLLKFAGKGHQKRNSASRITIRIRLRAVSLLERFDRIVEPFEFVQRSLKLRVSH